MTSPIRRRRVLDRSLAVALAVAVVVVGLLVYRSSDIRNADLSTGPESAVPSPQTQLPSTLTQKWSAPTDAALGAVVSPGGVVVTTDPHTVTAHDAVTGAVRWTYSRSNRTLCAVGSGDITAPDMSGSGSVAGIATVYSENGFCSQVMTFDPVTGARGKVRTSPDQGAGSLVFGSPYAGWLGPTRIEVWRYDLVRTIQYGDQANPPKPNQSRLGCTFTDLAMTDQQFATIEHCPAAGRNARVVINFDDPGAVAGHPDGWDTFQHSVRADIDTGAPAARVVGVTADRVAVLVSAPKPAVVVYDAAGKEQSRTEVDIPAADIVAADDVAEPGLATPAVQTGSERYSLVGSHVLAVSTPTVNVIPPATGFSTAPTTSSNITDVLSPSSAAATTVPVLDLKLDWVAADALGLPATVDNSVLLPTAKGLTTFDAATGPSDTGLIPVDRAGYTGRVDATAVGSMIVEDRGATVAALG